ncbi:mannose-1-phosphate guanylyltransferase [Bacteroidia bacterium]|nr:mannose-1-phosphate guanylyltransferase [Bacteroidia bacterium]
MNKNYYCVIMAGGAGVRFWPVSRNSKPKQFIDIFGTGETFLQTTFRRMNTVCPSGNIFIATNEIYRDLVKSQLPQISENQIICEPAKRNTAPCIAYANYKIKQINPDAVIVVTPSDHLILKESVFTEVLASALKAAENNDWLITLGTQPSTPNTGYGYIQFDENVMYAQDNRLKKVITFTEKPPLEMAKKFLQSGDFLWNAGIFVWNLQSAMRAVRDFLPDIDENFKQGEGLYNTEKERNFIKDIYPQCQNISIDYGVMEKADNVYVLSSEFGWSDVGTWGSLYDNMQKDNNKNVIVGKNVLGYDLSNTIVNVSKDKLVVVQALDGYIVAENDDILLICKKNDEQNIRQYVSDVATKFGQEYL